MLKAEAGRAHVPVDLADAVATIESGYNPSSIGTVGEIGLMQVRPGTAAMLGFKGSPTELARPDLNIRYGVTYLAGAWNLTKGDLCRTLTKYRSGYGTEFMTPLSISYCQRAHDHLTSIHSQLASLPLNISPSRAGNETLPVSSGNASERPTSPVRMASTSQRFWAAEEARVRMITERLHTRWRRMAAR